MIRSTSVRPGARIGAPLSPLRFGAATSDRIDVATLAALDDLHTFTVLMWVLPTTLTSLRHLWNKGAQKFLELSGTAGAINFFVTNAGGGSQLVSADGTISLNQWAFVAASYSSADKTPRMYSGRLRSAAVEDAGVPTVGSGAESAETGTPHVIGNGNTNDISVQGAIAAFAHFRRQLSLREIRDWQFQPRSMEGCTLFLIPGYDGTGVQVQNFGSVDVTGTITGAKAMQQVCPIPAFGPVRHRVGRAPIAGGFQPAWASYANVLLGGGRVG